MFIKKQKKKFNKFKNLKSAFKEFNICIIVLENIHKVLNVFEYKFNLQLTLK